MASVAKTPKGGYSIPPKPKPEVLLHCSVCRGEFSPAMLRLSWDTNKGVMYCPGCDPYMRRG